MMFFLKKKYISAAVALALIVPALSLADTTPAQSPVPAAQAEATAPASDAQSSLDGVPLKGKILETMDSNGYTYLLVDSDKGKIWVAIPETTVKTGEEANCSPGLTMHNFTSKTLNRTFSTIIFSSGLTKENGKAAEKTAATKDAAKDAPKDDGFAAAVKGEQKAGHGDMMGMGASTGSAGAIVPSADINVNKATGANSHSVGECFDQGRELDGKTVRVRGKVMKVSKMIMGKNWVHIQDGTGNPLKNQHDLVVTTQETPEVGSIVTVDGTLHANRDFGAGYTYNVIVEDAKIEK